MAKKKFYITTAIYYVNAKPHIGHAFEKIIADALARWHRQNKEKVWFLTGTDENAQKNVIAAREKDIPVKKFVDDNSKIFVELCQKLNISNDDFIRTTEERHKKTVQDIFKKIYAKGEIYKGKYEGLYCEGCEGFITEKDLVDGKCPEHNRKPIALSEEAYFFDLSKYKNRLIKFVKDYIVPEQRKKEILFRLENEELKDLCVSRINLDWGIDSPIDKKFKIYVWFDALINYISGANGNWPADIHIVGKGINWFHSVIWPAILISAGYELPKKLLVHGYLNIGGQKISKSLGNVINPLELIEKYGTDAVRYSLLRGSVFEDSDYSEKILIERYNNELANKLGNLVSRVASLIEKYGTEKDKKQVKKEVILQLKDIPSKVKEAEKISYPRGGVSTSKLNGYKLIGGSHISFDLTERDNNLLLIEFGNDIYFPRSIIQSIVDKCFENYEIDKALIWIFAFIDYCNWYIQKTKPWETKDKKILYELKESILKIAELLLPFIPSTSEKITKQFRAKKIKRANILFNKIKT